MIIKDLFLKEIDRPMDGVIKVEKKDEHAVNDEIKEYVITNELRHIFRDFCNYFGSAFDAPTTSTGIWISGHFGSGKSHLLKMLSYLLENKEVEGEKPRDLFEKKFDGDPGTFLTIDQAIHQNTEAILFDIDATGMLKKDDTVIIRIFAKKFYDHLGFYGNNLKIALMEQYLDERGLTEKFLARFEELNGDPWLEVRNRASFFADDVKQALADVAGMSEHSADQWFENNSDSDEFSIEDLVEDMKQYVDSKPDDYRLLFMIDEVGQYIGENYSMLLNMQTLLEGISDNCGGKIWVVCTGQEALDKVINSRNTEFARILGRFKMRLSLSASSVDEVIKKRLLTKKPEVKEMLSQIYEAEGPNLKNVFAFSNTVKDIKGFTNTDEFVASYPFVPYQFKVLQRVYDKAREAGNISIHTSSGARSMLSGFQESARAVMENEYGILVPFWMFYDTMQASLDTSVRDVVARCETAAYNHDGIEDYDVSLLKLLFMVHFVSQDIPTNLDNLLVLMSDKIDVDRITLREKIKESLERLKSQNYISRTGDCYNFLSDDEQEIQRGINRATVPGSSITKKILDIIYGDIYKNRKLQVGGNNFAFDQFVDSQSNGNIGNEMGLRFLSVVSDDTERSHQALMMRTKTNAEAIVVLADTGYYQSIETALRVDAYCTGRSVATMPERMRNIIKSQQEEAERLLNGPGGAREQLEKAITDGTFYVDGDRQTITAGDAKAHINKAMELLVSRVYYLLPLITDEAKDDSDIRAILSGELDESRMADFQPNYGAIPKMTEYVDIRTRKTVSTTMADVQDYFKKKPYGWMELDIACVMASLIHDQRVTVKYAGETIQPFDPRLPNMLRLKTEVGKLSVKLRQSVPEQKKNEAIKCLTFYTDHMNVRRDEDGLVEDIVTLLGEMQDHYTSLMDQYSNDCNTYPGYAKLEDAVSILSDILSQKKDNLALINRLNERSTELEVSKEDLADVEEFFANQVSIYDNASRFLAALTDDARALQDYDDEAGKALGKIRLILTSKPFNYSRIKELPALILAVRTVHSKMIAEKREEILEVVRQCLQAIHTLASSVPDSRDIVEKADTYYTQECEYINNCNDVGHLNGRVISMGEYKDDVCTKLETMKNPPEPVESVKPVAPVISGTPAPKPKHIKPVMRQTAFQPKLLESDTQIDDYVESIRRNLKAMLADCDGIQIK